MMINAMNATCAAVSFCPNKYTPSTDIAMMPTPDQIA